MKRFIHLIILSHVVGFLFVLFFFKIGLPNEDQTVIKFFPLDESKQFEETSSTLTLLAESDKDEYDIQWKTSSELTEPVYLRQDVSILFVNGRLKGVLSKWKESGQNLFLERIVHGEDSGHYQTVTFHHGEIHYPDDQIKSIQDMSSADLYVIDSPMSPLESFDVPQDANQKEWKRKLDHTTQQQLNYQWNQLIQHFKIPKSQYEIIPLTDLPNYETKPFPKLSAEQTQQVIGQLWEGLYKNYVLEITGQANQSSKANNSYVPLVLADKDGKHLLVLYEGINGGKQKLLQYYPDFSSD